MIEWHCQEIMLLNIIFFSLNRYLIICSGAAPGTHLYQRQFTMRVQNGETSMEFDVTVSSKLTNDFTL